MAQIGLKYIHYAKQLTDVAPDGNTAGSATYDTPKKIGNAVSADINPATNTANLYGDDSAVATATSLGEITVTLETTDIPLEDQAILLGHTFDSVTGTMTAKGSDTAPDVAILFESEKHDGGIRCVKLLKGKFAPAQETINTKGENLDYQVPQITGTFVTRQSDGAWKIVKDYAKGADTADWYTSV